jgi:hypothetical protein
MFDTHSDKIKSQVYHEQFLGNSVVTQQVLSFWVYSRIRMIGHILGYLPVSPNHMLPLITVSLKTEVTCELE